MYFKVVYCLVIRFIMKIVNDRIKQVFLIYRDFIINFYRGILKYMY